MILPQTPLGTVLELRKELVHPRDEPSGCLPFVGLEHIESGSGRRIGQVETDLSRLTGRKPRFYKGDIVYGSLRPYLNKVWIAEFDGICSVDQFVYRVRSSADAWYVAAFMRSPVFRERAPIAYSPGQLPRIRTGEVEAVLIPFPSLCEQRRIAALLDEAMAAVERARAAAEEVARASLALRQAILDATFLSREADDWPTRPLGSLAEIGAGITLGRKDPAGSLVSLPYLRVANVKDGRLELDNVKSIAVSEDEACKYRLRWGDLLLTEGGDPDKLGRGTYWQDQLPVCLHQNHIFRVRFDLGKFDPAFVAAQVGSAYGKRYFLAHAKQTTGIATINRKVLSAFPLRVPPLLTQQKVAQLIRDRHAVADALKLSAENELDSVRTLPQRLLVRAFSGNL